MPVRQRTVSSGDWRTLEWVWNAGGAGFFRAPSGARIRVRYGAGWLAFNRQSQTLDGNTVRGLRVHTLMSLAYARMQMRVPSTGLVKYQSEPGNPGAIAVPF